MTPQVVPLRETSTTTSQTTSTQRPWNVVVWNDPVTPMQVVVKIFIKIFGFSNNTATRLMMQVHHEGRSIVWSGALERAESYCVALQVAGLRSSLERAS